MTTTQGATRKLLKRKEAARYISSVHGITISHLTLDTKATTGGGPPYVKFGRIAYYDPADLDAWVNHKTSRKFRSTSDEAENARQ